MRPWPGPQTCQHCEHEIVKCLARGWVAVHHYRGYRNGVGEAPVYWRMCFGPKRPAGLPRGHEPIPVDDMAALAAYLDAPTPVAV